MLGAISDGLITSLQNMEASCHHLPHIFHYFSMLRVIIIQSVCFSVCMPKCTYSTFFWAWLSPTIVSGITFSSTQPSFAHPFVLLLITCPA